MSGYRLGHDLDGERYRVEESKVERLDR